MVALPKKPEQEIIDSIYSAYEHREAKNPLYLGRLGSSSIGHECVRQIWLSWRSYGKSSFSGRMLRLFETGHQQESRVVEDLRAAGFDVWDKDQHGEQFSWTDDTGHFVTKIDGVIKKVPGSEKTAHLLEIKTHNKNSFSALLKHGMQVHKPEHYAQMQSSMALSGHTRGLYVSVCKDDESFYVERIKEDKEEQKRLQQKVIKLVDATLKPAGISSDPASFTCKFCDMNAACYGVDKPLRTCRSCQNCMPEHEEGLWQCTLTGLILSIEEQRASCENYKEL